MLKFFKKTESNQENESFSTIKKYLSNEFRQISIKKVENLSDLSDMIMGKSTVIKARLDSENNIHIKIENIYGFLYEGFTQNYKWFIDTFNFQ